MNQITSRKSWLGMLASLMWRTSSTPSVHIRLYTLGTWNVALAKSARSVTNTHATFKNIWNKIMPNTTSKRSSICTHLSGKDASASLTLPDYPHPHPLPPHNNHRSLSGGMSCLRPTQVAVLTQALSAPTKQKWEHLSKKKEQGRVGPIEDPWHFVNEPAKRPHLPKCRKR